MKNFDMTYHIEQSNLIEGVDSKEELKNSLRAWEWLITNDRITDTVILSTHYMITKNLLPYKLSGAWRPHNVEIRSGNFVVAKCPHFLHVPELMLQWIEQMQYLDNLDPQEMHIAFEKIHPFADGNGRIGRMLMWYHEFKIGMEPILIEYEDRSLYYDWFRDRDRDAEREYEVQLYRAMLRKELGD